MISIRELIIAAHVRGRLRKSNDYTPGEPLYLPANTVRVISLDLSRTGFTGVEFGYKPADDSIAYAWQSVDGVNVLPSQLITELAQAAGADLSQVQLPHQHEEQPCQHYAKKGHSMKVMEDGPLKDELLAEEPQEKVYRVTQRTWVKATSEDDAIDSVNYGRGDPEVESQDAISLDDLEACSPWEHPRREDWQYEVGNGDTILGLEEWVRDQEELERAEQLQGAGPEPEPASLRETIKRVRERLVERLGAPEGLLEVGPSENGEEDWVFPIYVNWTTQDGTVRYALCDLDPSLAVKDEVLTERVDFLLTQLIWEK
jgi:hypothetical protein